MTDFLPWILSEPRLCPGPQYELNLLRQKGTFSAAGIGELICSCTKEIGAELMLVASHGAGGGGVVKNRFFLALTK